MGVSDRLEHCPVAGCFCGAGQGHPGFGKEALKAHIASHLLGITLGQVPVDWMSNREWVICPHCNPSWSPFWPQIATGFLLSPGGPKEPQD